MIGFTSTVFTWMRNIGDKDACALLAEVARRAGRGHPLTITALHETYLSRDFWGALRAGRVENLSVTRDLRSSEMEDEARRWQYLVHDKK